MYTIPQNVLFSGPLVGEEPLPPPLEADGENSGRESRVGINMKCMNLSLLTYLVMIIIQYFVGFVSGPFEEITNRPSISVVADFFQFFTVCFFPLVF